MIRRNCIVHGVVFLLIFLSVTACIDSSSGNESGNVSYVVTSQGLQTGLENQQTHVLRNSNDYSELMSTTQLLGVVPNPDFDQDMLVALFTTLNSCYSVSVSSVVETEVSLEVMVTLDGPADVCATVVGANYVFIETAQSPKQVSVIYE